MPIPFLLLAGEAALGFGVRTVASRFATGIGHTILSKTISGTLKSMSPIKKELPMAGANLPTLARASARAGSGSAKATTPPPLPKGKLRKLVDVLTGLGLWELATAAVDKAPEYLNELYASLTDAGVPPEKLATLSKEDARQVVLVESARKGVLLDGSAGLSGEEAVKYAALMMSFGHDLSENHDNGQVSRPTTGDELLDRAVVNNSMNRVAAKLALTGASRFRELYNIAMVLNMITEKDVELAELHEAQYGQMPLR